MLIAQSWKNILEDTPYYHVKGNANKKHSEILPQPMRMAGNKNAIIASVGETMEKL